MNRARRLVVFAVGAFGLGVVLLVGLLRLPHFGAGHSDYGATVTHAAPNERKVPEVVGSIVFDYRGIDSLEEEIILFAAVASIAVVLRDERDEDIGDDIGRGAGDVTDAVRVVALSLLPLAIVLGAYVIAHGHLSPGGGFQGGVIVAAASTLLFVASDQRTFRRVMRDPVLDPLEAAGMAGYVLIGLLGLTLGAAFLDNVFPLGQYGRLTSGGAIPLLSATVGLEVAAGVLVVTSHYADLLVQRAGRRSVHT